MYKFNDKLRQRPSSHSSQSNQEKERSMIREVHQQQESGKFAFKQYSDQDSLSEEDSSILSRNNSSQINNISSHYQSQKRKDSPDRESSQSESEEEEDSSKSIDEIEERIKKLEKDLQSRIDTHKKEKPKVRQTSGNILKVVKNVSSPPLPKKAEPAVLSKRGEHKDKGIVEKQSTYKSNYPLKAQKEGMKAKELEIKIISPKKMRERREAEDRASLKTVNEKSRVESNRNVRHSPVNGHGQIHQAHQLTKANRQIEEQQKALDQLRNENKRLKDQLGQCRKKKDVGLELDRLKQCTGEGQVKLDKEIEMLKIIEGLHIKLKRSIHRKLNGKPMIASSTLLHKGLPSTLLS